MSITVRKRRATLTIGTRTVTKHHHNPEHTKIELDWYRRVPWACPELLDHGPGFITIARHTAAHHDPAYRPVEQLAELLTHLESLGIHHRDVHAANVVAGPGGPLLIDWECAVTQTARSYDLYGPEISGVPVPDIHLKVRSGYVMWWGSPHPMSIRNRWETHCIPTT